MPELTTNQKGAIAEAAIMKAAFELGVEVYRPAIEGGRYDMIFALENGRLLRVQCKWAPRHKDVLVIRCYSCRRAIEGMRIRHYTSDEIDVIAVSQVVISWTLAPKRPATSTRSWVLFAGQRRSGLQRSDGTLAVRMTNRAMRPF